MRKQIILILEITNWWPTRKYETSTIIHLSTSYSPPAVFHWSVLFLSKSHDNFNSFCPMTSLLLKFTLICTWIWCSLLWFLPQRFYFWVFYSDSTLDQVELMFSRRVHACMLYFLHIWKAVPFDLYLNDIVIGCNILGSLFLTLGTL